MRAALLLGVPPLLAMLVLLGVYGAGSFGCGEVGSRIMVVLALAGAGLLGALALATRNLVVDGIPTVLPALCLVSAVAIAWIAIPLLILRPCAA